MLAARVSAAGLVVVDGAVVVAQAAADGPVDLVGLVNYGVLGLIALGFISRRIRTAGEVTDAVGREDRERARAEAAEAQVLRLYESLRTTTLPAVTQLADAATAALPHQGHPG